MIEPVEDYAVRREMLAQQIARQRGQLAAAYSDLEKPIRYMEYGIRAVGFIRQNSWIFIAVPAVLKLALSLIGGGGKRKPAKSSPRQEQSQSRSFLSVWGGRALEAYKLYLRLRPFFL